LSLFPAISGPPETGSYYPSWWTTSVGALQNPLRTLVIGSRFRA